MWGQWNSAYSRPSMGFVMGIFIDEISKIGFTYWAYSGGIDCSQCKSNNPIEQNNWVYVAVSYNPGVKIYINGQLEYEISGSCSPAWESTNYLYLPPWGIPSGEMYIDELIISNVVRSQAEIQERYYNWTH